MFSLPLEALGWELCNKRAAKEKHTFINMCTPCVPGRDTGGKELLPEVAWKDSSTTIC